MTTFMTFSVYSLRIASDMPIESNFVPMVTLYFILGISYTFMSFVWFIMANEFIVKSYLPQALLSFASVIKRALFWKFDEEPFWRKKVAPVVSSPKNESGQDVKVDLNASSNVALSDTSVKKVMLSDLPSTKSVCNNCDHCATCKAEKEKDKDKKKKKDSIESNVSALNHFICFTLFLIVVSCNLITWMLISNPPAGY